MESEDMICFEKEGVMESEKLTGDRTGTLAMPP